MPVIQLLYPRQSIELSLFIAAWKIFVEERFPGEDWTTFRMPLRHRNARFNPALSGLDTLCRYLSRGRCNTKQVTKEFFETNGGVLIRVERERQPDRSVRSTGAHLTPAAVGFWEKLPHIEKQKAELDAERVLSADQEDEQEVERHDDESARQAVPLAMVEPWTAIVMQIENEPFQRHYRRQPCGERVNGWRARWHSYFWPRPEIGPQHMIQQLNNLSDELRAVVQPLADADVEGNLLDLDIYEAWPGPAQQDRAIRIAEAVFAWGGVPQRDVGAQQVFDAIKSAVLGYRVGDPPMNSGWTKLAAFAVAPDVLGRDCRTPQVIWDSRVSAAIMRRLAALGIDPAAIYGQPEYEHLRLIPGRGGNRIGLAEQLSDEGWRTGWGGPDSAWNVHFCGGRIVGRIRDALNAASHTCGADPQNDGPWSLRNVEMVLFMDGY